MRPHPALRGLAAAGLVTATTAAAMLLGSGTAHAGGTILNAAGPGVIDGRYIAVFADSAVAAAAGPVTDMAQSLAAEYDGTVDLTYHASIRGFATTMDPADARRLAADPAVDYVEAVHRVAVADTQTNPPSWGIDRVDQRDLPVDDVYSYPTAAGSGVTVYVIDTGVRLTHETFEGRASSGYDFIDDDPDASDCYGHGTHVAGTVAGREYGVAKKADVVSVRVLDCQGYGDNAIVAKGIDWVTEHASGPSVANMSLGDTQPSQVMEDAVQRSIDSGVQYALAAGNNGGDACTFSPARLPAAVTVGSTTESDGRSGFSNYGTCLDLFAPGSNIVSSANSGDTGRATMSGTSMATPHVAGAMALYLSANPDASPQQVRDAVVQNATTGAVGNPGSGSPNKLLYTGFLAEPPADDDFSVGVDPSDLTVEPGASATATVSTEITRGDAQTVSLSADGLPAGARAVFDPASLQSGASSTLTLSTSADTPDGTYTVTVTAAGTEVTRTATLSLTVGDGGPGQGAPTAAFADDCWAQFFPYCMLDASASSDADGSITVYEWDFGDGSTGYGAMTGHFYDVHGTYTVTLTVTDDSGLSDSVSRTVTA